MRRGWERGYGEKREARSSSRAVARLGRLGERRKKGKRCGRSTWKDGGNEGREKTRGTGEGRRECRGNAGGAAQNRVAAGSGSASRLSLAIALVRRVKVGINGRRTLLGTRGVRWGTGELEEGPLRFVAGARHSGGNHRRRRRCRRVGVSSWVPKEEKLSWRTGTPLLISSSPLPLTDSGRSLSSLPVPSVSPVEGETEREHFRRARERSGRRAASKASSFVPLEGSSRLVHLSFRRRKLAERG